MPRRTLTKRGPRRTTKPRGRSSGLRGFLGLARTPTRIARSATSRRAGSIGSQLRNEAAARVARANPRRPAATPTPAPSRNRLGFGLGTAAEELRKSRKRR